jgi:hypothetical protein
VVLTGTDVPPKCWFLQDGILQSHRLEDLKAYKGKYVKCVRMKNN